MPPVAILPEHLAPTEDRIVVEPDTPEEMTASGLHIPEMAKELPTWGTVLAVGPGRTLDNGLAVPTGFAVGERVFYGRYAGMPVTLDGRQVFILRASDIFAKLNVPSI